MLVLMKERPNDQPEPDARLCELMSRMAAGDNAAIFELNEHYGRNILAAIRAHTRTRGVSLPPDVADSMVLDFCIDIANHAGGWRPEGGASPWKWAERRLHATVGRHLATIDVREPTIDSHDHVSAQPDTANADAMALLDALVLRNPFASLLREALQKADRCRNIAIFLDVELQRAGGDPTPAQSIAELNGLRPENVRQIVHRARARLKQTVTDEPRYADLRSLRLVAGGQK